MNIKMHPLSTRIYTAALMVALSACGSSNGPGHSKQSYGQLNDTGVTECLTPDSDASTCPEPSAPGQDAEFGRDALASAGELKKVGSGRAGFDFTKLGRDGSAISIQDQNWQSDGSEDSGTSWRCVQDNATGLVWEIKETDTDTPQYFGHTYSWYDPNPETNGGDAGAQNMGQCAGLERCDTAAYIEYANETEQLCGRQNWRLPSVNELLSIADQSLVNPPLDPLFFPNPNLNAHWTFQTVAFQPELAWYIYFTGADNGNINKSNRAFIRLVNSN